jgi:phosphoglycolate phosphatase-like HAD superfamily hydrolase
LNFAIFDIDGTLIEPSTVGGACFIQTYQDVLSLTIQETNWNKYKDVTDSGITFQIFKDVYKREPTDKELENIKSRHLMLLKEAIKKDSTLIKEVKGALDIIEELKKRQDWIIGIATGSWKDSGLAKLEALNLNMNEIPYSHAEVFLTKQEMVKDLIDNVKNEKDLKGFNKVVYVGDREYDYRTAQVLNIDFVGVDCIKNGKLRNLGVKKVIEDFSDKELFFNLLKS